MHATQFVPIGNGTIVAALPAGLSFEFEEDGTLVAWLDASPDLLALRVSGITAVPESDAIPPMNEIVAEDGVEKGLQVFRLEDKAYFVSDEQADDHGELLWVRFWEIGFLHHRVIISLCCAESSKESRETMAASQRVPDIIESLRHRETHSELTEIESQDLEAQREVIREVLRERYDVFTLPAVPADLPVLQQIIDERVFSPEHESEWACVGVVFGDVVSAELGLRWCVFSDENGVEPALRLAGTSITLFPRSMILKRMENGEEIDLAAFLDNLAESIEELKAEGC
jgi:hypothetical protein